VYAVTKIYIGHRHWINKRPAPAVLFMVHITWWL